MELLDPVPFLARFQWCGNGRKPEDRLNLFKAFVAKAVYSLPTNEVLVDQIKGIRNLCRLCGWETCGAVPFLSTFSRAFTQFAESGIGQLIHETVIRTPTMERKRVFSSLKGNHGGRHIRVRGPKKGMAHLMFGILAIIAMQLFRLRL